MLFDKYSIVSNSCSGAVIYQACILEKLGSGSHPSYIECTNPFITTMIVNDYEYVKLCENYEQYINMDPRLDEPKENTLWYQQTGNSRYIHNSQGIYMFYPVFHLGDIEIHCIHGPTDLTRLVEKFNERRALGQNLKRLFLWSAPEMFNQHSDQNRSELLRRFLSLKGKSIFLTNRKEEEFEDTDHLSFFVPSWTIKQDTDRAHNGIVSWFDHEFIGQKFKELADRKFNNG